VFAEILERSRRKTRLLDNIGKMQGHKDSKHSILRKEAMKPGCKGGDWRAEIKFSHLGRYWSFMVR
jgi:hypothetical protein